MALIQSTAIPSGATGYQIDNSLRFNDDDNTQLERTFTSAGDRKKWTWSAWIKRGNIATNMTLFSAKANTGMIWLAGVDGVMRVEHYNGAGGYDFRRDFDGYHRDSSAWYHFIIVYDSAQGSEVDRIKFYRNGEAVGVDNTANAMTQNFQSAFNSNETHWLGAINHGFDYDGYMAEVNFVDGQTLTPSDFGETGDYGEWKPIEYEGTYGTNGFYLNFETAADMGDDKSGNGNDFAEDNIAATDQMVDSPTNNFATWNPLFRYTTAVNDTYSEGNLKVEDNAGHTVAVGTIPMTSGKWYWEVYCIRTSFSGSDEYGMFDPSLNIPSSTGSTPADVGTGGYFYSGNGWTKANGSYVANPGSQASVGEDDIIAFAYDVSAGTLKIYVNNSLQKTLTVAAQASYVPSVSNSHGSYSVDYVGNFGQDSSFAGNKTAQGNQDGNDIGDFYYTPPTGFLALCTKNLPDVAVVPSEHFNTVLYTGNQGTNLSITGVGFEPSLVWGKNRSSDSNHWLFDAVRGTTKMLSSDGTGAEETQSGVTAFGSDGFTLGTWIGSTKTNDSYVAWNWKANGSGSANTNGSINSTVSANTDAGFSIINWTKEGSSGTKTVGHGLSKSPEIIFFKEVDDPSHWSTYVGVGGSTTRGLLYLNLTAAQTTNDANQWSDTAPTSTVFTYNQQYTFGNNNTAEMIGYAFHSVDGYSKVGSYTGNGNADGTFVYTGFRPAFIMWKRYDAADDWIIIDNKRDVDNGATQDLRANLSGAEQTAARFDMVSNGFKWRATWNDSNTSGGTYIYIAFAETPFKYSNGR